MREILSGWGRALAGACRVFRPSTEDGVRAVLDLARRTDASVGLRGAGQSYGDASLNTAQVVLDVSRMTRILSWDPGRGVIRVEPGVTIRQLWQYVLEDGWWPPVVPGTSHVSLGGAVAMNVHGKNNWKSGPIGDHVREIVLLLPGGTRLRASRSENADVFHAAIGGFGMLGCIVEIELQLHRVTSGDLLVEPIRARDLGEMLGVFESRMSEADYLVGWVDCFPRGRGLGRGLVHQGRYVDAPDGIASTSTLRRAHQELPDALLGVLPKSQAWRLMRTMFNAPVMRAINSVKYWQGALHAHHTYRQPLVQFSFLLDFFPGWGLAYGPYGMIQYQSFVPAARAERVFRRQLELAHEAGIVPLLGVLKRHRPDDFLMSHAVEGYSLALEFKRTRANREPLRGLTRRFDDLVNEAGGRFYFAKDGTLTRDSIRPLLAEERTRRFAELKRRCDPDTLLQTDLYRRLFA
ncbi:FAD-binding oxidoreductase [Candidatus Binatia bacterium]|nr:FAD-binding oxidoreductase [Candidatus Binatia bacterium]